MPPHFSLLSSSPTFLLLPRSCSLWRDSPMSFKMASVKLLATQQGTNRCPLLFLSTHIPFFLWQHAFFSPLITAVTGVRFPFFHLFQCLFFGFVSLLQFVIAPPDFHPFTCINFVQSLVFFLYFQSIYLSVACLIKTRRHCCIIILIKMNPNHVYIFLKNILYCIFFIKKWLFNFTLLQLLTALPCSCFSQFIFHPFITQLKKPKILHNKNLLCNADVTQREILTRSSPSSVPDYGDSLREESQLSVSWRPADPHEK